MELSPVLHSGRADSILRIFRIPRRAPRSENVLSVNSTNYRSYRSHTQQHREARGPVGYSWLVERLSRGRGESHGVAAFRRGPTEINSGYSAT